MRCGSLEIAELCQVVGEIVDEWDELIRYFVDSRVGVVDGTATHECVETEFSHDRMLRGRFAFVRMVLKLGK